MRLPSRQTAGRWLGEFLSAFLAFLLLYLVLRAFGWCVVLGQCR